VTEYSVIVPAFNAADTLPCCLAALGQQSVDRAGVEVIVVDDGSSDLTAAVAGQAGAKVFRVPHAGPATARNVGARAAQGSLLLFTDADCEPAADWIERMACAFDDPSVIGAKGVYRSRQTSVIARFVQQEYQDKYDRMTGQPSIDFVDTYSAGYRREAFLRSGGFDTAYTTASVEDQELSFRLAAEGHRLVFAPDAIVYHRHDATPGDYLRRKVGIGYWKALLLRRHPQKATRDSHTPQVIKMQMGLLAVALALTLAAIVAPQIVLLAASTWLAFGLTMLPFLIKIARRDPGVLLVAPWMIALRTLGLGLGLAVGLIWFGLRSAPTRVSHGSRR